MYDINDVMQIVNDPTASVRDITAGLYTISSQHYDGRDDDAEA
jgi:hypothetical protein